MVLSCAGGAHDVILQPPQEIIGASGMPPEVVVAEVVVRGHSWRFWGRAEREAMVVSLSVGMVDMI